MTDRQLCGRSIHPIGFGAMPLSWSGMLDDRDRAIETIHAALDAGCRHIDTSNIYAPSWEHTGHNESLVAEALDSWGGDRADVIVATKDGLVARPEQMARDCRRDAASTPTTCRHRRPCEPDHRQRNRPVGSDHIGVVSMRCPLRRIA